MGNLLLRSQHYCQSHALLLQDRVYELAALSSEIFSLRKALNDDLSI